MIGMICMVFQTTEQVHGVLKQAMIVMFLESASIRHA